MKALAKKLDRIVNDSNDLFLTDNITWDLKPTPTKWSGKEIIGHLIDSANNNIQRFVRGGYERDFKIIYNQDEWVKIQHYKEVEIRELLLLWTSLNKQLIRILENYPEEKIFVTTDIGQQIPEIKTMYEVAEGYIDHLVHHLTQLTKFKNAPHRPTQ